MRIIEAIRERQQRKHYDRPMGRAERAPVAKPLLAEIDKYIEVTPEFNRAVMERRIENRATQLVNGGPIEYDTPQGHFSILRGSHPLENGAKRTGAILEFTPSVEGDGTDANVLKIMVYYQTMAEHAAGIYGHGLFTSTPYAIGGWALEGTVPGSGGKKFERNSRETADKIYSLLPVLFPALERHKKMTRGVSER